MTRTDESPPGPLDLMESARTKYRVALGRLRRGPPELALLSLHGSIEDALRGFAMQHRLPASAEPFPQLLDAMSSEAQPPLSSSEAEGVRRMHRLRARIAHGEQIAVTAATVDAYHRLAARLLPRYGVLVVGPEGEADTAPLAQVDVEPTAPRRRPSEVEPIPPRHGPERGRATARLERPPRERSAYPDDRLASYSARPRRGDAGRGDLLGQAEQRADRWRRSQPWLVPLLAIVSIFLVGAAVSISLQQLRAVRAIPTPVATPFAPQISTAAPQASPEPGAAVNGAAGPARTATLAATPQATASPTAPAGALAPGLGARVSAGIPGLNLRERPGVDPTIPILLALQPGTDVAVVEGPVQADGLEWWKVRVANIEGWCAGQYLEAP